jgi:voltage-gated potassium channel
VITISTVGFTEVQPLDDLGKIFVSVYILFNIGVFAYLLSVFSYYIIQGEIFKTMHINHIKSSVEQLSNHVIVCGFGKYGREITQHFLQHKIPFVVIDINPEKIGAIQDSEQDILYIEDDATHDEALVAAGVSRARSLIAALPEDSDNVFIVLTARQLNPALDIISRAKDPKSQKKLMLAGANHVVMPEQIGGFYMATLVSKPGAVEFFSFITNEHSSDIGFEELAYEHVPLNCRGRSLSELKIRQTTGANVIGFRDSAGYYHINPSPETTLNPHTSFIVLGDKHQLLKLKEYLKEY